MAKLRTPLLSFGATGQLAKTLVFFAWKGIDVAREYIIPSNPQTAAQTTQRGLFTSCVSAWRNYVTSSVERTAWNRDASVDRRPMSGFNAFCSSLLQIIGGDPDASYANGATAVAGNDVDIDMLNMDDGATGDEAGNFDVWIGDRANSLLLNGTQTIAAGVISTGDIGDTDDVKYVQIRKGGFSRSGIYKVTLIV